MNSYLLSYNTAGSHLAEASVTAFVKANRFINKWSLLFDGTYLIKSSAEFSDLDNSITDFLKPTHYIISEISPTDEKTNGLLPKKFWEWLVEGTGQVYLPRGRE